MAGRGEQDDRSALARLSAPAGLCATCAHLRLLASARSVFVRCGLSEDDPRFPRYPPLPVLGCDGYERTEALAPGA
jgi:hypothetical protein